MSDMRRRDFLTTIPAAGLGAFVGNKEESASTTEIMQPTAPTYYALSSRKGGFVLKIQGLNLVRVEQSTTNGVAKDASIYCLDVGKSVGAGSAHYPTLIVPKACVAKPSKAPDTVMGEFALYKLAGNVTLTVPKPGAPTFTEGAVKSACGSLPAGLGSFLQVRAGLKREFAEHGGAATPAELEKRSIAWMTLSGGRLEHATDFNISDPADIPILVRSGKYSQTVRQILYYGSPDAGKVTFRISGEDLVLDCAGFEVVAGLANLPLYEMMMSKGDELAEYAVLKLSLIHI